MPLDTPFELANRRVWVAGHGGMVGSALVRRLRSKNCEIIVAPPRSVDLTRQGQTEDWLDAARPDVIFVAAARVGGILANDSRPAEFLRDNLAIETNIIHGAYRTGVAKLIFLGSSCIYPRDAVQPMKEESLLTGPLEPTNQWYAIAKIAGVMMCQAYRRQYGCDFISVMPTNLYGPGDNFDLAGSHVVPALMRKAHEAKADSAEFLSVWGSGRPRREFLYVDDCADAIVHLARHYSGEQPVNVGTGEDISIHELAELISHVVGFDGKLSFDHGMLEGVPRKLLDVQVLHALGWHHRTSLETGLQHTYAWYLQELRSGTPLRGGSTGADAGRMPRGTVTTGTDFRGAHHQ
jgi:GDP-L-fucose synthase